MINNENNNILLELVSQRDQNTVINIIENHVQNGNYIIIDSWRGYLFLNNIEWDINIILSFISQVGRSLDSTSKIESVWAEIKYYIKIIYNFIKSKNFVYFITEVEYLRITKNLNLRKKFQILEKY